MKFEKFCDYFFIREKIILFTQALNIQIKLLDFLNRPSCHLLQLSNLIFCPISTCGQPSPPFPTGIRTLYDTESSRNSLVFDLCFQKVLCRKRHASCLHLQQPPVLSLKSTGSQPGPGSYYRLKDEVYAVKRTLFLFLQNYWLSKPLNSLQIITVLAYDFSDI